MKYNFDVEHDRKNTNSVKHDLHRKLGKREDLIPLWIADMDFKVPQEVEAALARASNHGIFGYSEAGVSYYDALTKWFADGFDYHPTREISHLAPGVVFAITVAIRAFTNRGDGVLIQRPVYHPFGEMITATERKIVVNSLVYKDGKYTIDFEDFERKIVDNQIKLFILCSPHNPAGRVWTRDELTNMGEICIKHNCLIVSDEIHCDFVYAPHKHLVFATIKPEFADNSIICTAPSKTFNLPGLQNANIFIANSEIRKKFHEAYVASGYSQMNTLGLIACEAAYRYGREWLNELLQYLSDNMKLLYDFGERTGIKPVSLEGTYLAWLDFSPLKLTDAEINKLVTNEAGLWLSPGLTYGNPEGSQFQRMNIASPRRIIEKAISNLERALGKK